MSGDHKKTAIANLSNKRVEVEEPVEVPQRSLRMQRRNNLAPKTVPELLQVRDAPPPPVGYRYTMDGRLVPEAETTLSIEDPDAQDLFCEVIEVTGSFRAACDALGIVSSNKVRRYIDRNPEFAELVEAAADRHRQGLYAHAVQRATVGYLKPIIGGPTKDQIVGYERVVSDSLLALMLKRHFVEFREAGKAPSVTIDASKNVTVNMPNMKDLPREKREALRQLLKPTDAEPTIDPDGIIDIDPKGN